MKSLKSSRDLKLTDDKMMLLWTSYKEQDWQNEYGWKRIIL